MIKKEISVALGLFFVVTALAFPQTAARRALVEVRDVSQNPVEKVKITVSSPERRDFKKEYVTNKKGQASFLLPMEIKSADFNLEKDGYQSHQEAVEFSKLKRSQEEMSYQISFVLYRTNELTPSQRLQRKGADEKALVFFNQGIDLFNAGNFRDAIAKFEKSVEVKPDFMEGYQNLASSYFRDNQYEKAISAAQKALEIEPKFVQMIKLVSVAYSKLGDETKALEYQEKLKAFPDTEFSVEELYNLGVVEANKGNDGEAAKYFEKAALAKPDFPLAHYHLGLCYFRLNNGEGAKRELEKYLALAPEGDNAKTARALLASIK